MVKELVEDIKRYRADREINARLVLVFNSTTKAFEMRPWRDVKVSLLSCSQHLYMVLCQAFSHFNSSIHQALSANTQLQSMA